jgi:hypothetical protein
MLSDKTAVASYASSGFAVYLGTLDWNLICMLGGLVLGILTFGVNWYYKRLNAHTYRDAVLRGVRFDEPKE